MTFTLMHISIPDVNLTDIQEVFGNQNSAFPKNICADKLPYVLAYHFESQTPMIQAFTAILKQKSQIYALLTKMW